MKIKTVVLLIILLGVYQGWSFGEVGRGWADLWNFAAYEETNFESRNFKTGIFRFEGRLGVSLFEMWKGTELLPYLAYVGVASGDRQYWNNSVAGGGGFRFYPFRQSGSGWVKEIKLFWEALGLSYLKAADEAAGRPAADSRFGLDLWYEWNQIQQYPQAPAVNYQRPWGETWTNIAYRQTNFYQSDFNALVANIQLKNGLYLGGDKGTLVFQPYLRTDLAFSGRKDFWLNNFTYGLGVRVEPFRGQGVKAEETAALLYKFKIFLEALGIAYLNEQPQDGRPNTDARFGVEFTMGR